MREQVYVKFAEALLATQAAKQAEYLLNEISAHEIKIAEIDHEIEQLQAVKEASVSGGAGLQKMAEFDSAINTLMLEKEASKAGLAKLMAQAAKAGLSRAQISKGSKNPALFRRLIDEALSKMTLKKTLGGADYAAKGLSAPGAGHMLSMQNARDLVNNAPGALALLTAPLEASFPVAAKAGIPLDRLLIGYGNSGGLGNPGTGFAKRLSRARKGGTSLSGSATGSGRRAAHMGLSDDIASTGGALTVPGMYDLPVPAAKNGYLGKILAALGVGGAGAGGIATYNALHKNAPAAPAIGGSPMNKKLLAALGATGLAGLGAGAYALSGSDDEEKDKA